MTSQPHLFSGSQLDISIFSTFNNFLVCSSIFMKFAPNSLVLEILHFGYNLTVFDSFALKISS